MNELALDPTETRQPRAAAEPLPSGRPLCRIAFASALGVAGLGAFAAASALMSDLTGSRGAPISPPAVQQSAADWPDLKDGLPALATGSLPGADMPRRIALPAADAATAQAPAAAAPKPAPVLAPKPLAAVAPPVAAPKATVPPQVAALPASTVKPAPTIENAPVIAPTRQAGVLPPPNRTAPTVAARPTETVRARTASTSFAALPPAPEKAAAEKPAARAVQAESRKEPAKPAEVKAETKADEAARKKAEKAVAARKPAPATVASAQPAPAAEPEETEVFGIKVPTLAATGRRIGASVEALGDAVKGLPDRF